MAPPTQNNQTNNENSFESFFNRWMVEQENYLGDLLRAISECNDNENEPRCRNLIDGVMILYNQYYEAKTRLIQENVFSALTPSWLSPFERTYLWLGGFRPGVAFRLVTNNVHDLTEEQSQRIDRLMRAIKHNEQQLSDELNRVQDRMVSSEMVELARHMGRLRNGAAHSVESALDSMRMSMETLVECADILRKMTFNALVEILKPLQAVKFIAATIQLQLVMRREGQNRRRDATA